MSLQGLTIASTDRVPVAPSGDCKQQNGERHIGAQFCCTDLGQLSGSSEVQPDLSELSRRQDRPGPGLLRRDRLNHDQISANTA